MSNKKNKKKNNYPFKNEIKLMKDDFKRMIDELSDEDFISMISFLMYSSDTFEEEWAEDEGWEDEAEKFYNKGKNNMKREIQGITLVALVVTIIVLLILAGVSISLVFNSDGLFSKANDAASRYNQAKEGEQTFLQGAEQHLDKHNEIYGEGEEGEITSTPEPTPVLPTVGEEPPEEGWTIEEAKGLVARDGLKVHLGEKVQYSPTKDTTGVYRIFYYDNEVNKEDSSKGYFGDPLGTLYLKRDYVSRDTALGKYISHSPSDNGTIMKQMNPKWASSSYSAIDNLNEHCVAWLCDPEVWKAKYKVEGIANYVIGSPSVEMYMKAFGVYKETDGDPDRNSTALVNRVERAEGYGVGANNSYSYNSGYSTADNTIEAGPNNIFMTTSNGYLWWLSSPSTIANGCIICLYGANARIDYSQPGDTRGICPIVSVSQ